MKYIIDSSEVEYQPNSVSQVLCNKLGITSQIDMNEAEEVLLFKIYDKVFEDFGFSSLVFQDICNWHRQWLGSIYEWAGALRGVNMSKGGFPFAAASNIPKLVDNFEKDFLARFPEISQFDNNALVSFLAKSHVEFILIHPFREGNGRISRLLMDVIATEAGKEPLNYSLFDEHKEFYFKSIQAGVAGDYLHLERLIKDTLLID